MDFTQWLGTPGIDMFPLDIAVKEFTQQQPVKFVDDEGDATHFLNQKVKLQVHFIYQNYCIKGGETRLEYKISEQKY